MSLELDRRHFLLTSLAAAHRRDIERMTARWGERAGVAGCTPHRFRHTFATRLLRATKNLRLVQTALAHPGHQRHRALHAGD